MPLIISLVVLAVMVVAVSTFFCAIYAGLEDHWPHWHFGLFASWWWPFRAESAATLAAIAIDADPDAWTSKGGNYGSPDIVSESLKAHVSEHWLNHYMTLSVDGKNVPLTAWDEYRLFKASRAWAKRRRLVERKAATVAAAETFGSAFRKKYGAAA